jgi:hypothetical protein
MSKAAQQDNRDGAAGQPAWVGVVRQNVETLRFGVVLLTAHAPEREMTP